MNQWNTVTASMSTQRLLYSVSTVCLYAQISGTAIGRGALDASLPVRPVLIIDYKGRQITHRVAHMLYLLIFAWMGLIFGDHMKPPLFITAALNTSGKTEPPRKRSPRDRIDNSKIQVHVLSLTNERAPLGHRALNLQYRGQH